ncbi:hypothetical protein [Paenibacillus sp. HW567]|uniref:hypothetical protein n=1 Tax=Paenibacillus sp. HW567 TaxID=1034769 RepID=UPI000361AF4E|nr:hypothetical protein [Paenibacillus sp. HW567]
MNSEREQIKQRLDEELCPLTFSGRERVLRQTHPRTLIARLRALWNMELVIPLRPLGACAAILMAGAVILYAPHSGIRELLTSPQPDKRELIEAGGNTYRKDLYEQAVKRHDR